MPSSRPIHYLTATHDPQLVAAILVSACNRVQIDEFALDERRLVARHIITLRRRESCARILEHLDGRGYLRLRDVGDAASAAEAGVPIREMRAVEQDIVHLLHNLWQALRDRRGSDA